MIKNNLPLLLFGFMIAFMIYGAVSIFVQNIECDKLGGVDTRIGCVDPKIFLIPRK